MKMDGKKPYLAVIMIQAIYAGMFLLSKAAFDVGMNTFVFVFYRQAAATVFLAPLAMFFEWKNAPAISGMTLFKIFMLSFFGITLSLNVYGVALIYTSASVAAATTNSLPVITFFIAVLLRMEMVKLRTNHGIAKIAGVAICLGGAAIIALYRGPSLKLLLHHHLFEVHHKYGSTQDDQVPSTKTWIKGCFLMLMSNTFWGLWLVLQARVMKSYPSKLLFTTLQCFFSSIQSLIIAIALERDPRQWKLQWNVRLVAVAYCKELATRDLGEVQVRVGGGLHLVLSFPSKEVMKEKLMLMKSWLNEWCDSVLEWKQGMSLAQERHVWLSCYGVPLNLWNCNTFVNIGKVWGAVSALDEDTRNLNHFQYGKVKIATSFMEPINQILNLECQGALYPVRVCEEQIIFIKDTKLSGLGNSSVGHFGGNRHDTLAKEDNQIADRESKHEEDDDHVAILDGNEVDPSAEVDRIAAVEAHDSSSVMVEDDQLRVISVVAESDLQIGMSEDIGYACQDSSARLLVSPKKKAVDGGGRFEGEIQIQTSGVIKTMCGPEIMGRGGINLVVDLKSNHEPNGSGVGLVLDHSVVGPSKLAPLNIGLAPIDFCNPSLPSATILQSDGVLGHLHPQQIGGLSVTSSPPNSFTSLSLQRKATSKKHRQMKSLQFGSSRFGKSTLNLRKGAVFRSAAAATSLSMASKSSRGRIDLSEAEATLELGKSLGIDFEGKDEEVISKLLQLEANDLEKVRTRVGDAN